LQRRRRSVSQAVKLSALIHADETEPALPFPNVAMPRAKIAVHAPVRKRLPPAPFVQRFRLLKYFQFVHSGAPKGGSSFLLRVDLPQVYTSLRPTDWAAVLDDLNCEISNLKYLAFQNSHGKSQSRNFKI
jgi:hypothetical protein